MLLKKIWDLVFSIRIWYFAYPTDRSDISYNCFLVNAPELIPNFCYCFTFGLDFTALLGRGSNESFSSCEA